MILAITLGSIGIDPLLQQLVLVVLALVVLGFIFKLVKQPYIIAYIIAGLVLGPDGFELIKDKELIASLGSIGLVLLMFFIGMEFSLPNLFANWKMSVVGTLLQVLISIAVVWMIGAYFDWGFNRILFLGFVISISSTAVVIKLLQDSGEMNSMVGQNVVGILLAQDILIVPMLLIINYLGGEQGANGLLTQSIGALLIVVFMVWLVKKKRISLPFEKYIENDHELQVLVSFAACLGFALLTGMLGLSTALGAFLGGVFITSSRSTEWFHESLHSFRVIFVALFFLSIGLLIELDFILSNLVVILALVLAVFLTNNLINTFVFRMFKFNWKDSLQGGATLSQIGEFSFVLGATGYQIGIVEDYGYQMTISVICLTLLLSPIWIALIRKISL